MCCPVFARLPETAPAGPSGDRGHALISWSSLAGVISIGVLSLSQGAGVADRAWDGQRGPASDPSGRVGLSGELSRPSPCLPANSPDIGPLALSCDSGGQGLCYRHSPLQRLTKGHRAQEFQGFQGFQGFQAARRKAVRLPLRRAVIGRRYRLGIARGLPTTALRHAGRPPESRRGDHQQPYRTWAGAGLDCNRTSIEQASSQLRHFIQCFRFPCTDFLTSPVARPGQGLSCRAAEGG